MPKWGVSPSHVQGARIGIGAPLDVAQPKARQRHMEPEACTLQARLRVRRPQSAPDTLGPAPDTRFRRSNNRLRPAQALVAKPRHQDTRDGLLRRLLLARHAKSSWGDPVLTDHDRPLNARGYRAAQLVGAALSELGCVPDVVLSSTATRTRETWVQMEPHFGGHPRVEFHRALYLAAPRDVLATIADAPDEAETVMVLGHNPSTLLSRPISPARATPARSTCFAPSSRPSPSPSWTSRRTAGPAPTRVASSSTSSCREGWSSGSDPCPR